MSWYFLLPFAWSVFFSSHWLSTACFSSVLWHPHNAHRLRWTLGCCSHLQSPCAGRSAPMKRRSVHFKVVSGIVYHSSSSNPKHISIFSRCGQTIKTWLWLFTQRALLKLQCNVGGTLTLSLAYRYATQRQTTAGPCGDATHSPITSLELGTKYWDTRGDARQPKS